MMDVISGQVPDRFRADHPEFTAESLFGFWAQSKQVCTRSSVPSPCDLCVGSFAVRSLPYIKLCVDAGQPARGDDAWGLLGWSRCRSWSRSWRCGPARPSGWVPTPRGGWHVDAVHAGAEAIPGAGARLVLSRVWHCMPVCLRSSSNCLYRLCFCVCMRAYSIRASLPSAPAALTDQDVVPHW